MRWCRTAGLVVVVAAVLAQVVSVPALAAAPAGTLRAEVAVGQQLDVDDGLVAVRITARASDCSEGCTLVGLYEWHWDRDRWDKELLRWSAPGGVATTRTVVDRSHSAQGWLLLGYSLRSDPADPGTEFARLDAPLRYATQDALRYDHTWRKDVDLTSTEHMIMRSRSRTARGSATFTGHSATSAHAVGVVAERGPGNGVLAVSVEGRGTRTVDLRAPSRKPRQVVVSVEVPEGATMTVANATPSGRSGATVQIDGLVTLGIAASGQSDPVTMTAGPRPGAANPATSPRTTAAAAEGEYVVARVAPQQLPLDWSVQLPLLAVTAYVRGCPTGCVLRGYDEYPEVRPRRLLSVTTPASADLQPLTAYDSAYRYGAYYGLRRDGQTVASSKSIAPVNRSDEQFDHSWGWSRQRIANATHGTLLRTSERGTGATWRVSGLMYGRSVGLVSSRGPSSGVMAVYNDGVLVTRVDLHAAQQRPRQVVASLDLRHRGRVTVINETPPGRTSRAVDVDGVVELYDTGDCVRC